MKLTITDNTTQVFTRINDSETVVYIAGSLGGGTASMGYKIDDVFYPLTSPDGITTGEQYIVTHGKSMAVYFQLTGATNPSLTLVVKGNS